jgi:hypothetical protein
MKQMTGLMDDWMPGLLGGNATIHFSFIHQFIHPQIHPE